MSKLVDDILKKNKEFVESKKYLNYTTDTIPNKHVAIVSCMDSRLSEMLLPAIGFNNGDAKIIKNAGAVINSESSDVIRSLIVATNFLGVNEIIIIMHKDCGMKKLNIAKLEEKFSKNVIDNFKNKNNINDLNCWLSGFENEKNKLQESISYIKNCPMIEKSITVSGLIIDPSTGELEEIIAN